jgi:hypothetical protein
MGPTKGLVQEFFDEEKIRSGEYIEISALTQTKENHLHFN